MKVIVSINPLVLEHDQPWVPDDARAMKLFVLVFVSIEYRQ